jgi:hypothetical protein
MLFCDLEMTFLILFLIPVLVKLDQAAHYVMLMQMEVQLQAKQQKFHRLGHGGAWDMHLEQGKDAEKILQHFGLDTNK